jgi:uncharacterized protein (TIGR02246 family)
LLQVKADRGQICKTSRFLIAIAFVIDCNRVTMNIFSCGCLIALGLVAPCTMFGQNDSGTKPCKGAITPEAVVQAQVDAYNSHDVSGFASCYAEDATVRDLSGKRPELHGREAIRDRYQFLKLRPARFGVEIIKRVVNGPIVVDVERPHDLPTGTPQPPDNMVIYEVRNGMIVNVWFPPH